MRYFFKPSALRDLKILPKSVQIRIIRKLDFYVFAKNPLSFARPIKDHDFGQYRFRVGDYRIIFDIFGNRIIILAIGHRREIYK